MCGRFVLTSPRDALVDIFRLASAAGELRPRYNIAPSQRVAIVRATEDGARELSLASWGLIPSWAKDRKIGNQMINARAETAAGKPAFRSAFRSRRCVIAADGFYEWQRAGSKKQPFLIRMRDGRPFGFAGLWERWKPPEGDPIESCTILTTAPNELMSPIHDRMPVILAPDELDAWLDPSQRDPGVLQALLDSYPTSAMEAVPVGTLVNNPRNDVPACLEPLA